MRIDFEGQVVVVTGATRGIGKQLAEDFERLGAELILTGTDPRQIAARNREAEESGNGRKTYHAVDFTDDGSLQKFLDVLEARGRIDVCVNNAGINRIGLIDETALNDWEDILAVNLHAPVLITRAVSRGMKARGYGRIVNIASIFSVASKPKRSFYTVTKFGLHGLTVSTALDLAPYGVLVNTVSPGFVLTDLTKRILTEEEMDELAEAVPVGRFADPDEISRAVLFLASRHNTYMTAQNLVVDGGFVNV
ncbi:MAG: SDR family NAD(P)-dependent oxidoreductase [Gemmatimonadota bacterium]